MSSTTPATKPLPAELVDAIRTGTAGDVREGGRHFRVSVNPHDGELTVWERKTQRGSKFRKWYGSEIREALR